MSRAAIAQPLCINGRGHQDLHRFVVSYERPERLPLVDGPDGQFYRLWLALADAPLLEAVTGFSCDGTRCIWEYD